MESFQSAVLIFIVPWGVTGITLLFPRLSLASYAAEDKVTKICITLNSTVSALVRGFCAADTVEFKVMQILVTLSSAAYEASDRRGNSREIGRAHV